MPIELPQKVIWKIQELQIILGSSVLITLSSSYLDEAGAFIPLAVGNLQITMPWEDAAAILTQTATAGKNRYDDIADALYGWILQNGNIQGQII